MSAARWQPMRQGPLVIVEVCYHALSTICVFTCFILGPLLLHCLWPECPLLLPSAVSLGPRTAWGPQEIKLTTAMLVASTAHLLSSSAPTLDKKRQTQAQAFISWGPDSHMCPGSPPLASVLPPLSGLMGVAWVWGFFKNKIPRKFVWEPPVF